MSDASPRRPPVRPAERYGDGRRTHPLLVAAVALLAVGGTAFVVWVGLTHTFWAGPQGAVVGYGTAPGADDDGRDDGLLVDGLLVQVEVRKAADATAVCEVEALDANNLVVGTAQLRVGPAEEARVVETVRVATTLPAVAAAVTGCTEG